MWTNIFDVANDNTCAALSVRATAAEEASSSEDDHHAPEYHAVVSSFWVFINE